MLVLTRDAITQVIEGLNVSNCFILNILPFSMKHNFNWWHHISLLCSTAAALSSYCHSTTSIHYCEANSVFLSGSGKTYTMQPLPLRAVEDLVRQLHRPVYRNQRFKLWLSYFEIYGGKLFDLLSDRKWVFLSCLCVLVYLSFRH